MFSVADIKITYETLFDFLRRERNRDELQTLDPSFYEDVVGYLSEKHALLKSFRHDDELLASAESEKARIQFTNIKKILKEIYDRREKKIAILALNVARTGTTIPQDSLLPQEKLLFNEVHGLFVKHRRAILSTVLAQVSPTTPSSSHYSTNAKQAFSSSSTSPTSWNAHAPVAASSQGASSQGASSSHQSASSVSVKEESQAEQKESLVDNFLVSSQSTSALDMPKSNTPVSKQGMLSVHFLKAVPRFAGVGEQVFGPYKPGDKAELPEKIASVLLKKGRVESS